MRGAPPLHLRDGGFGQRQEGRVAEQHLGLPVAEDIGHGIDIEPRVDRVQHRAAGGHAEMRLGLGGHVGQQGRHHVAGRDPARISAEASRVTRSWYSP
jgi:hypothetical protein